MATVGLIGAVATAAPANAYEYGDTYPKVVIEGGPWAPVVWVIGDSISADDHQANAYIWFNAAANIHTRVEAAAGSRLSDHWTRWDTFRRAGTSNASAIVVELGTNDIGFIATAGDTNFWGHLGEVNDQLNRTVDYLQTTGKCIVWVGLDEHGNIAGSQPYDVAAVARGFNTNVKNLTATHSRLHYADYTNLIDTNATFRASLNPQDGDSVHPAGDPGKQELAYWLEQRVHQACSIGTQ